MSGKTTKRCHWVAQSYLRTFAADPGTRSKIWRFSRSEGEPELKPIAKVAVKFHLYAPLTPEGVRDDSLEKKLSSLETWFGSPIWSLLCSDFADLSWEPLRKMVALLVAVTYLRNPRQLEQTKDLHQELVTFLSMREGFPAVLEYGGRRYELDSSTWPAYRDACEEEMKRHWNDEVSQATWLAETFLKMRWAVVFSDEPVFITSDHPVVVLHPSLQFRGFNNPETTVMFPLSPTRVLMLDHRHGEPDAQYYPLRHDPAITNGLIWRDAIDYMFSSRHPDSVCAEMLADAERQGFA